MFHFQNYESRIQRISAVKRVKFVRDRMAYTVLRGHWYNITALNVHSPTEEKLMNQRTVVKRN